jgi:hypothetical protein
VLPFHQLAGLAIFILVTIAALMGITERAAFANKHVPSSRRRLPVLVEDVGQLNACSARNKD